MICFALQNFKSSNPFLLKTLRYHTMVKSLNTKLFWIFIKIHINWNFTHKYISILPVFIKILYISQFSNIFWIFFKKLFFKKMGLYSNNLMKSHLFYIFNGLDTFNGLKINNINKICIHYYSKPIQTLNFSFHKKTYNSLIFLIKNILVSSYYSHLNFFKLYYSFIFYKKNFILYPFNNNFYFKIRNN